MNAAVIYRTKEMIAFSLIQLSSVIHVLLQNNFKSNNGLIALLVGPTSKRQYYTLNKVQNLVSF